MVGAKGWLYDRVFDRVHDLGLEDRVIFLGQVESRVLPALYNGARLFVYPSLYEGFGLPVLEAMACGAPTIASNVSSLPEVTGDAAVLVDPMDVPQIARDMGDLLQDGDQRDRLRQEGLKRAARFTWQAAARKTLAIYEQATKADSQMNEVTS
jgi:glycosyltransferase involved in cell wall biosynthesis